MAIKLSGPLSFDSDIVREFISDNAIPADFRPHSLSEYYKLGEYVPDASPQNDNIPLDSSVNPFGLEEIKFSDFYGAVNQINVEFFEDKSNTSQNFYFNKDGDSVPVSKSAANVNLYDIADDFVAANVDNEQTVPFVFTIDSDACFNNSIQTGGYFSDLTIINKGIIAGRGGSGGSNGGSGSAGNAAIKILDNFDKITIDNLNGAYIAGGGGGGRGGSVSHSTKTAQSGGGGGWNGGSGGSGRCTVGGGYTNRNGGNGVVITSKNSNSSGGNGNDVIVGITYGARVTAEATGNLGGGGGGACVVGYIFDPGIPNVEVYKTASISSGAGGGNKITPTASGGGPGGAALAGGARAGSYGASGGGNQGSGGTGNDIPRNVINPSVTNPGGGGGWGAAGGGSGSNGGKAVQKTGTGTLTYTATGTGNYYGTKDT